MKAKNNLGRLISILYRKNQVYLNEILKPYDISSTEQPILMYLYNNNGVTQEEIATYLQIDKASMARSIQSLMKKAYVSKEKDVHDHRCNKISLTKKSIDIRDSLIEELDHWNATLLADFTLHQQDEILDTLQTLVEKLENLDLKEKKIK
ncbi:DNA-binding MarR family transcriptional regulator [Enterococcus sp. PF1-24]|uniref:MarR family winged helix-turn-helix transcriptional regulator n=1 Tax=unclassified Enterococcus TaxID=2608891 RepID=UPI0024753CB0|nr:MULTISPECIES: MarR family transcriptional regulator [unclassified Enterococcus]MDH6365143.1 DNA-binding MarR family transcriptional regulator [Enterococcus sp. PFB1-1]MDH6402273.1 DNA-binding MarR family transcriptional regulator [Enterococcus sp. PF1-24]